jgi:glycerol-3-phosphate dehydrogenase
VALTTKKDGRLVFVLPWGDLTLVGTTDTDFRGDPDRVLPDPQDVSYLLEATNEAFPGASVGLEDVVSAYAGLRPLVRRGTDRSSESEISREHEIFVDSDGLISVAGGKFTTHRAMAEEVVDLVETRLARRSNGRTQNAPLGPPLEPLEDFLDLGIEEVSALHLQGRYSAPQVGQRLDAPAARDRIVDGRPNLWAEVDIAVGEEMALTLADVLVRRLGLFYEASDQAVAVAPGVAARMAVMLGWDSTRTSEEVAAYRALVSSHRAFLENPRPSR